MFNALGIHLDDAGVHLLAAGWEKKFFDRQSALGDAVRQAVADEIANNAQLAIDWEQPLLSIVRNQDGKSYSSAGQCAGRADSAALTVLPSPLRQRSTPPTCAPRATTATKCTWSLPAQSTTWTSWYTKAGSAAAFV